MSKGKFYSLEEARKADDPEGFVTANSSSGDKERFEQTRENMVFNRPVKPRKDKWGNPTAPKK